jgi:protein-tyrosine phosphatase
MGMDPEAAAELGRLGGEPTGFTARRLIPGLVASADLVLGMAREHREAAARLAPAAVSRCYTLREYVRLAGGPRVPPGRPEDDDIADPYGSRPEVMRACAQEIAAAVHALIPLLTSANVEVHD